MVRSAEGQPGDFLEVQFELFHLDIAFSLFILGKCSCIGQSDLRRMVLIGHHFYCTIFGHLVFLGFCNTILFLHHAYILIFMFNICAYQIYVLEFCLLKAFGDIYGNLF